MIERVQLRSADRLAGLVLTYVDFEDYTGTSAIAVDVELEAYGFAGAVPSVWFQRGPLDEFGEALVRFERERSGSVSVCNLGAPGASNEFTMSMAARSGGHASLQASVRRLSYRLELTASFNVDGGELGQFVRDWRGLFAMRLPPAA